MRSTQRSAPATVLVAVAASLACAVAVVGCARLAPNTFVAITLTVYVAPLAALAGILVTDATTGSFAGNARGNLDPRPGHVAVAAGRRAHERHRELERVRRRPSVAHARTCATAARAPPG